MQKHVSKTQEQTRLIQNAVIQQIFDVKTSPCDIETSLFDVETSPFDVKTSLKSTTSFIFSPMAFPAW